MRIGKPEPSDIEAAEPSVKSVEDWTVQAIAEINFYTAMSPGPVKAGLEYAKVGLRQALAAIRG